MGGAGGAAALSFMFGFDPKSRRSGGARNSFVLMYKDQFNHNLITKEVILQESFMKNKSFTCMFSEIEIISTVIIQKSFV
jgi:hypothetical protein